MNPAQLENIELRLAAVRGRPWVVTNLIYVGPQRRRGLAYLGERELQVSLCASCRTNAAIITQRSGSKDANTARNNGFDVIDSDALCESCSAKMRNAVEIRQAAFRAENADRDECAWLAKAPEDIESLIHAVKSLSDERDALRRDLERERSVARGVADERSKAILELSRLKASLATLREVLQ